MVQTQLYAEILKEGTCSFKRHLVLQGCSDDSVLEDLRMNLWVAFMYRNLQVKAGVLNLIVQMQSLVKVCCTLMFMYIQL